MKRFKTVNTTETLTENISATKKCLATYEILRLLFRNSFINLKDE